MTNDGAMEFVNNEQEYQNWLKQHPQGFVVNTPAKPDKRKEYTALHKASCSAISRYSDKITAGAYTERDFIKVCANDVSSLVRWTARIGRIGEPFSSICGLCKPSIPASPTSLGAPSASVPTKTSAPVGTPSQSNFWTPDEFTALLERCRALPVAQGNYIINDYVENILLTVLDFQMQTPTVEKAARHYKDKVQFQLNSFSDLQNLLAGFPDDQEGNTQIAQYLWGYKLWTRVSLLRRLLKYLEERGITTQEKLKEWAFQSNYNLDMAGKVKGIGFGRSYLINVGAR